MNLKAPRFHGFLISAFCSLMLGSTLMSAKSGVSMAAVGGGLSVTPEVADAGWAVPEPLQSAAPKMGHVQTVSANVKALSQAELQAVIDNIQSTGANDKIPGAFAQLMGISNGADLPCKSKGITDPNTGEFEAIFVANANGNLYAVLLDRSGQNGHLFLTNADGTFLKGYAMSAGPAQPVPTSFPGFGTDKTYWESQTATTTLASQAQASKS